MVAGWSFIDHKAFSFDDLLSSAFRYTAKAITKKNGKETTEIRL